jgi:PAS domain S-box-containing protein
MESEDKYKELENKYFDLYNLSPTGYITIDEKNSILEANPAIASMLKVERDHLKGRNFSDFIFQKDQDNYYKHVSKFSLDETDCCDVRLNRDKGFILHVKLNFIQIRNSKNLIIAVNDVTAIKETREALYNLVKMEFLISGISTRFINSSQENIDNVIKKSLKEIGEYMEIDRIYMSLFSEDTTEIVNSYEWYKEGLKPMIKEIVGLSLNPFSWVMKLLEELRLICFNSLSDVPPEGRSSREFWEKKGIKSICFVPLYIRRKLIGTLAIRTEKKEKIWTDDDKRMLSIVGEIFINVLEKERTEKILSGYRKNLEELVDKRTEEVNLAFMKLMEENQERKKSENKFRSLYEEHYTLLEAITDIVLVLNPRLEILWHNSATTKYLPVLHDVSVITCQNLFCNNSTCRECPVTKCFSEGTKYDGIIKITEDKYYNLNANPIKDNEEKVIKAIVIVSDITEKIKMEKKALRTAHLASIGELAAGVAHEINNPVNTIINYGQIILNKSKKEEKVNYIAGKIITEGDRIAHIVKNLLSFSRYDSKEKSTVFVKDLFSDTISLIHINLKKNNIDLKDCLPDNLPGVFGNSIELSQVFLNILTNAIYALNEKYHDGHQGKTVEISGEEIVIENTPFVRIIFCDYGCGIPADIQNKIMNPFFSTKPPGKGTGLGLSISYGIIESHKGHITIESKEGEFTRVIIDLPVYRIGEKSK